MKNLFIAVGWITWALVGAYWLKLGQPTPDNWPDTFAMWIMAVAHGMSVGYHTGRWQARMEARERAHQQQMHGMWS